LTRVLADTSALVKWFVVAGEDEVDAAQVLLNAHRTGQVTVSILDLTMYELGNTLPRKGLSVSQVADSLDQLEVLCGPALALDPGARRRALQLAQVRRLTFYDAAFAAAAEAIEGWLVSADRLLLAAGLAESVSSVVERLRLRR
jgi:predicted nucleic acid-binding protein